jgi:tRNA threonylcarbamoyladenosine modification (KEOPS) complex  Pcc1 subunit
VSVTLEKTDGLVIFKFNAKDPTALRAALNSYLRWFSAVERSLKSIEALQSP